MIPAKGGPPLDDPPVCGAGERWYAERHVLKIEAALDQEGWSRNQRRYLKLQWKVWTMRAMGMDEQFERRGTIGGHPDGKAPSRQAIVVEGWRRAARQKEREFARALSEPARIRAEEVEDDKQER